MCTSLEILTSEVGFKFSANKRFALRRKKVWELEHRYHCSIAGTCFTLDEVRRFCRKCQIETKGSASDYELHTSFVAILGDAHAARPAAKYLDRKYKTSLKHFEQADSQGKLKALWNEAVSQGGIAAAFWSVLTHPLASEELLFHVYREVHMLSHLSGASIRLDMQVLTQLQKRVPKLEQELALSHAELLRRTRKKDGIIETLNKQLNKALQNEQKLQEAEEKIQLLENGEMLRHLSMQVASHTDKLKSANVRAERAEANAAEQAAHADACSVKNAHIESQLLALTAERNALENALENTLSSQHASCDKSSVCQQKIDLAGRCILYVGGREESPQRLDALLSQVDAVLCPMDCVSHDAVNRIKRDCKRYGKHLMLLPQSSLSAFTQGIHEFSRVSAVIH